MKRLSGVLALYFALALGSTATAALPPAKKPVPQKILTAGNSQVGGIAGSGFSLLDVKSTLNRQARLERLIIDVGDVDGHTMHGLPGYFNVELARDGKRIVVDFSQMPVAKVDLKNLQKKLKDSIYVKEVKLLEDPSDNNLSLILDLRKSVKMKVFQVPGQKMTSKVVLDLLP